MINNGIISQIDGYPELCRKIVRDVYEIEEGYFTFENLSTNEIVNQWEERGESWDLLNKIINSKIFSFMSVDKAIDNGL